ncbi:MAG TPA: hypothetical protein PK079_06190 [Leptospiraceae bacterium]|nr:hypothetical protein [Leptospiraceae bacterium]HMW07902.1 hypothetical protein [Leptospiraceae bacterium]HMX33759.1 hypothetical protein [Leptospiraceae bacterium]HMY31165.1 hypothetical protein [Leptospiraceae bacterium]HMZ65414.1 hypothetical protein [Leptospiraceae bacterium]
MKNRSDTMTPSNFSGYVNTIKENVKRKYSHYKVNKVRQHYRDGLSFEDNAEYSKAIESYLECLKLDPDYIKCLKRLAKLYSNLEEHSNAIQTYTKIAKLQPNEENFFELGQEYYKQNRFKKAILCLKKSLYYKRRFIQSHRLLASIYARVENRDKTEQYLSNVIKIDPNHKGSMEELIKLYFIQGRYRDSLNLLEKYKEVYVEDSNIKFLKSDIYVKMGKYSKALNIAYESLIEEEGFQSFIEDMQYKKVNPTLKEKDFLRKIVLIKNEKKKLLEENLKSYQSGDETKFPDPKISYDLALLYLLLGNQKKAMKYLFFARQLNEERKYI